VVTDSGRPTERVNGIPVREQHLATATRSRRSTTLVYEASDQAGTCSSSRRRTIRHHPPLQWLVIGSSSCSSSGVRAFFVESDPSDRDERLSVAASVGPPSKSQAQEAALPRDPRARKAPGQPSSRRQLTVGRSPGCGVSTVDDVYTSTLHRGSSATVTNSGRGLGSTKDLRELRADLGRHPSEGRPAPGRDGLE